MDNLKQELERRGHGAKSKLAAWLGISPSAMTKKLQGTLGISDREAERIGEWLKHPVPPDTPRPASPATMATGSMATRSMATRSMATRSMARPAAQPLAPVDLRRQDLPVWAAVQGGEEGAMLITTSPIDWIARPRELEVRDAFAVFLIGDSMSPRYDQGDQLYVHPHRPPRGGDDCLFIHEAEGEGQFFGLAKTLVRATSDKWRVKQFNPAKEFDLDRRKWTKAWKIVGKMNRM